LSYLVTPLSHMVTLVTYGHSYTKGSLLRRVSGDCRNDNRLFV